MSIAIINHYSLLNTIDAANPLLPDLQSLIAAWHGERIRRIDRYIQLCIAGGLHCVEDRKLPADTGVYLASRAGAVTTSAAAMSFIQCEGALPKPLHFVNTLGNSAGYYLTRLLQVNGNTLVVADEQLSFEAALAHAAMDLQAGRISMALVGGFDEVALPLAAHIERLGGTADTQALTEGSHWLLLQQSANEPVSLNAPVYLANIHALERWLNKQRHPLQLSFKPDSSEQALCDQYAPGYTVFSSEALTHGTYSGAALVHLLQTHHSGIHLARNNHSYCATVVNQYQNLMALT